MASAVSLQLLSVCQHRVRLVFFYYRLLPGDTGGSHAAHLRSGGPVREGGAGGRALRRRRGYL